MQQQLIRRNPSFGGNNSPFDQLRHRDIRNRRPLQKRISLSQDSLCRLPVLENMPSIIYKPDICRQRVVRHNGRRLGLNNRISKSEDCLNDLQKDLKKFKQNPEIFQKNFNNSKSARNSNVNSRQDLSCISSDDEYFTDSVNLNDTGPDCDANSQSSYSITTEANCDFEFFQSKDIEDVENLREGDTAESNENLNFLSTTDNSYGIINEGNRKTEMTTFKQISQNHKKALSINNFTEEILARSNSRSSKNSITDLNSQLGRNFRITRSNSKRSLENFQAYVDEEIGYLGGFRMQRSNSFMTIEDRKKLNHINSRIGKTRFLENNNFINKTNGYQNNSSNNVNNNNKNLLQNLNSSIAYLEDMYTRNNNNNNIQSGQENYKKCKTKMPHHGGSVPDFKKIFISEYI